MGGLGAQLTAQTEAFTHRARFPCKIENSENRKAKRENCRFWQPPLLSKGVEDGQEGLEVDSAGWVWLGHREGPQSLEVVCLGHWQGFRETFRR